MRAGTPIAEIVIAVHDARRPVGRAVESIVGTPGAARDGTPPVRVTVVCHNLPATAFAETAERFRDADVRWVELLDGIRSPAGPFNHGLALAEAPWVGVMGSDDSFDPGAIDAMVRHLRADAPQVLLYPLRHQGGRPMANPLSRRWHHRRLDPVKDRLAYRTAPLALIRRTLIAELGLQFTPGLRTGEDAAFSARLWNLAERIDFHPADPGYVIGADAVDRVTSAPMEVEDEVRPYRELFAEDWVAGLPPARREALVVKTIRIHLMGALLRRARAEALDDPALDAYRDLVRAGLRLAPEALAPMSRRDRAVLDTLLQERPVEVVRDEVRRHDAAPRAERLLTRKPTRVLARESDLRRMLRYVGWPR